MIPFPRSAMPVLSAVMTAFTLASCLQLETPHTFQEDEELKIRARNLHSYYQELEESIRLEQYHIKLLQDTLNIKRTEEQTMAAQIEQKQRDIDTKSKDNAALSTDIAELEKTNKTLMETRKGLEAALAAEKKKTSDIEKSIGEEAGRIGQVRVLLNQTMEQLKKLEEDKAALDRTLLEKNQILEKLKGKEAGLDAELEEEVRRLAFQYQEQMERKARGSELEAAELGRIKSSLTQAALGLERLEKGIDSLQQYYEARKGAEGDLESIRKSTADLLEAIQRIQNLFEEKEEKKDKKDTGPPPSQSDGSTGG